MNEYLNLRRNSFNQKNRFIVLLRVRNEPKTATACSALQKLFSDDFFDELGETVRFEICEQAKAEHDEYEPTTIAFVQYKHERSHYALKRFHNIKLCISRSTTQTDTIETPPSTSGSEVKFEKLRAAFANSVIPPKNPVITKPTCGCYCM